MTEVLSDFYIDKNVLEHGCCWDTAICCKTAEGEGQYGKDVAMFVECTEEDASFILAALNTARNKGTT